MSAIGENIARIRAEIDADIIYQKALSHLYQW